MISSVFREEDAKEEKQAAQAVKAEKKHHGFFQRYRLPLFFVLLVAILIAGTRVSGMARYISIGALVFAVGIVSWKLFSKDEIAAWLTETWMFTKKIFPLLLIGIFIAGVLTALLPENFLATFMGENTVLANLTAVLFGVFMYFPTLVEVPMAKMFLGLGMAKGPLLAYLLADPVISLASILVVKKFLGWKRTLVYAGLITVFTTIAGLLYGMVIR